jgi:hypothetical protein
MNTRDFLIRLGELSPLAQELFTLKEFQIFFTEISDRAYALPRGTDHQQATLDLLEQELNRLKAEKDALSASSAINQTQTHQP